MNQALNSRVTSLLADYVANHSGTFESPEAHALAKLALLDVTGVAIAARNEPLVRSMLDMYIATSPSGSASVLGHAQKFDPITAATINGSMNHALDFDDTLPLFMGHPSAVLWGALLPLAQARAISPARTIEAYLVGLEFGCLLAQYLGHNHYVIGWHGTATVGRNAAAAACAYLLGLSVEQTSHALAIAGTTSGGVKASFGTMCKPFHAGSAAGGGVQSALLAEAGMTGSPEVYESRLGLGELMGGERGMISADGFAEEHPATRLSFKFHAACHCTHAPIEITLDKARQHHFGAEDVDHIQIYFSQISMDNANITDPLTGLDGKFSTTYAVASALLTNSTGIANFTDEKVRDPETRKLMERIDVTVDDAHRNEGLLTTCEITLKDGSTHRDTLDPTAAVIALEEKQAGVSRKFDGLVGPEIGDDAAIALRNAINSFEGLASVDDFFSLVQ